MFLYEYSVGFFWLFRKPVSDLSGYKSRSSTVSQESALCVPCFCKEVLIQAMYWRLESLAYSVHPASCFILYTNRSFLFPKAHGLNTHLKNGGRIIKQNTDLFTFKIKQQTTRLCSIHSNIVWITLLFLGAGGTDLLFINTLEEKFGPHI